MLIASRLSKCPPFLRLWKLRTFSQWKILISMQYRKFNILWCMIIIIIFWGHEVNTHDNYSSRPVSYSGFAQRNTNPKREMTHYFILNFDYCTKFLNWHRTSRMVSMTTAVTWHTQTADFWADFEWCIIYRQGIIKCGKTIMGFMRPVVDLNQPGVMLTSSGQLLCQGWKIALWTFVVAFWHHTMFW